MRPSLLPSDNFNGRARVRPKLRVRLEYCPNQRPCATRPFMRRKLRIQYPGAIDHIRSRGDRREDIFFDDVDGPATPPRHPQKRAPSPQSLGNEIDTRPEPLRNNKVPAMSPAKSMWHYSGLIPDHVEFLRSKERRTFGSGRPRVFIPSD
jgi:hypothetical protein